MFISPPRRAHRRRFSEPIVFIHGLGCGLLLYYPFVKQLVGTFGGDHDIFCVSLPHIAQRATDEVPTARETALLFKDLLNYHGYRKCHLIGHSFGTIIAAYVRRYCPGSVGHLSLLDPVCFHVLKTVHGVLNSFRTNATTTFLDAGIAYFGFRELFTVYVCLRTVAPAWQEAELTPVEGDAAGAGGAGDKAVGDLIPGKTLVYLGERDSVVQVQTIRRQLLPYANSLRIWYEKGQTHGGFLLDSNLGQKICDEIYRMGTTT